MNKEIKKAVDSLREDALWNAASNSATVNRSDLSVLLEWAEKQAADEDAETCELAVGDRVELKIEYVGKLYTRQGALGTVNLINTNGYSLPYEVVFDGFVDEYPVNFKRGELRKVSS